MILMHMAYGLDMIALSLGTGLFVWSIKNPGKGGWIATLFGALVMIFSVISIVCLVSCAMRGEACHRPGPGGMMMGTPPGEAGHDHMMKMEHKK